MQDTWVRVAHNPLLEATLAAPLQHDCRAIDVLKRPEVTYQHLQAVSELDLPLLDPVVAEQVEIQSKYAGYIERQQQDITRLKKHEKTLIPADFDYNQVSGLSTEVMQKLMQIKPLSIAQAGRISGVTPSALSLLLVHLKKQRVV